MPGRDGTGPLGMGPMTGRGRGVCCGSPAPTPFWGGRGRGGGGFGNRCRLWGRGPARPTGPGYGSPGWQGPGIRNRPGEPSSAAGPAQEETLQILTSQAQHLEDALKDVRDRIQRLKTKTTED
ncbi:MAG TPA: DUF5320 domain-containing protein [Syntrophobacteraceae bacterium]|nr:DUF5320 domain-containing protein [Syntrophobacteraceae bacterium]